MPDNDARFAATAKLQLVDGVALLQPDEQVFTAMLDGWRNQQLSRRLASATVEARLRTVRAFADHALAYPWHWRPQHVDDYFTDLRAVRRLRSSTLRGYQNAIRLFCAYLTDPAYGWTGECETRFGTHPSQVVHEWNAATHVQDNESDPARRAFTRSELQQLFDYADDQVARIRADGRKGWLSAFRDATILKITYAYGLRRNEVRMLDVADFSTNPHAAEFGDYGVCHIRHGKAMNGSPPKRRSVLTVFPWTVDILEEWSALRTRFGRPRSPALWPTEKTDRIGVCWLDQRFAAYRAALNLPTELDFHSLRRSYITHLIEDGWDALFVQQQAGHEHASTTSLYTCVSSNFRTRTLRKALDATTDAALNTIRRDP